MVSSYYYTHLEQGRGVTATHRCASCPRRAGPPLLTRLAIKRGPGRVRHRKALLPPCTHAHSHGRLSHDPSRPPPRPPRHRRHAAGLRRRGRQGRRQGLQGRRQGLQGRLQGLQGLQGLRLRPHRRLLQGILPGCREDHRRRHREEVQGGPRNRRRPPPPHLPRLLRQWLRRVPPDRPSVQPKRREGGRAQHLGARLRGHRRRQEGAGGKVPQHRLLRRHHLGGHPRRRETRRRPRLRGEDGPPRLARLQPRGGRQQPARPGRPRPQARLRVPLQGLQQRGDGRAARRRPQHRQGQVHLHRARRHAHGARILGQHKQGLRRAQQGHRVRQHGREQPQRHRRQLLRQRHRHEDAAHHRPPPGPRHQDHAHHRGHAKEDRRLHARLLQGHGEAQRAQRHHGKGRRDQEDMLRVQQPHARHRGIRHSDQLRRPRRPRGLVRRKIEAGVRHRLAGLLGATGAGAASGLFPPQEARQAPQAPRRLEAGRAPACYYYAATCRRPSLLRRHRHRHRRPATHVVGLTTSSVLLHQIIAHARTCVFRSFFSFDLTIRAIVPSLLFVEGTRATRVRLVD